MFFSRRQKNISSRILKTYGLSEAMVKNKLKDVVQRDVSIETLSHPKGVDITLTVEGESNKVVGQIIEAIEEKIRKRLAGYVFGVNGDKMEIAVGRALLSNKKTISVAESCTGGLICHWLTNMPGSSEYFKQGIVAYSNESKTALLNVQGGTLNKFGAVSQETAEAMAAGIKETSGTDIGLAATGIAGPGGGTVEKPVGLVYIGFADTAGSISEKHRFKGQRELIKIQASQAALDLVRRNL